MMFTKHRIIIVLLGIVLLGAILRLFELGAVPAGFHRDEAFFGYNAYSLLKTGREMTGSYLPLHLSSFLNSPALYSYFAIPFIVIFKLTPLGVRLPSAIFGVLTIPLLYILVLQLFRDYKKKELVALSAAFFLAVSPWHINLSRVATENVLVTFFIVLGLIIYLKAITRKSLGLIFFSLIIFAFTLLIYQAPRAFVPLLIPLLFFIYFRHQTRKMIVCTIVTYFLIIVIPVMIFLSSPVLSERIHMLSIFNHPQTQLVLDEQLREDGVKGLSSFEARLFHNKAINFGATFLSNYSAYFTFDFFISDKTLPIRYMVPMMGLVHGLEFMMLLTGAALLIKNRRRESYLLFGWILLSPIGSALTFDDIPNIQRTLMMIPALSILCGYGLFELLSFIKKLRYSVIIITALGAIFLYQGAYFLHQYYTHGRLHKPWYRNEGYEQLVSDIEKYKDKHDSVIVTEAESDPYIFYFFYTAFTPEKVQAMYAKNGATYKEQIGNVHFVEDNCPLREESMPLNGQKALTKKEMTGKPGVLYVNHGDCKVPANSKVLSSIHRSDNSVVFTILEYTGDNR